MARSKAAENDPFRPPDIPVLVQCIHCGQEYDSYLIEWVEEPGDDGGFWCCPVEGCDGKGFGFDIFPVDPEYQDERGGWCYSEDEDEDDEDEDDWEPDDDDALAWLEGDEEDEEMDGVRPWGLSDVDVGPDMLGPPDAGDDRVSEDDIPF
jgi:hypothetical protein